MKKEIKLLTKESKTFINDLKNICLKNKRIYSKKIGKLLSSEYNYISDNNLDSNIRKKFIRYY